jgi:hypothetical protein
MSEKITIQAGTIIGKFHLRDGIAKDGKMETAMLANDVTLILPTEEEHARLPEFTRKLRENGFTVAVCGFECWIINSK